MISLTYRGLPGPVAAATPSWRTRTARAHRQGRRRSRRDRSKPLPIPWPPPTATVTSPVRRDDRAPDEVRVPDEVRGEHRRRARVDVARRAELLDPALVHDRDPVGHHQRLDLVVRHVDERRAELALDRAQLQLHVLAELEVERRERLVEQQDARLGGQRPRQRRALDLAAGQLGRPTRAETLEPDEREQLFDLGGDALLRPASELEAVADVLDDVHVREQRPALEDDVRRSAMRRHRRHVRAMDPDVPLDGSRSRR